MATLPEVVAVIREENGQALVLAADVRYRYNMYQEPGRPDLIVGIDDSATFVQILQYGDHGPDWLAFDGYAFDVPLESGEIIHCSGQWWRSGHFRAEKILGFPLAQVKYNSVMALKKQYRYLHCDVNKDKLTMLLASYNGPKYSHREYHTMLRSMVREQG